MKNQRLEFGEIPRINCTEKTSLKCPSKSSFDSDLTTLCSRQIEPSGIITANFHTIKPPTHFIPQICFCKISLESLLCFMGKQEKLNLCNGKIRTNPQCQAKPFHSAERGAQYKSEDQGNERNRYFLSNLKTFSKKYAFFISFCGLFSSSSICQLCTSTF